MNMAEPYSDQELENFGANKARAKTQAMQNHFSQFTLLKGSHMTESIQASANDAKYQAEYKAGQYQMTEAEFVSLRRAEDGLEPFIPATVVKPVPDLALNPLASGL